MIAAMKWTLPLILSLAQTAWATEAQHRGRFYWGHEVQSFRPCGSKKAYWVRGEEKTLKPVRERAEKLRQLRGKPYQPVYIEALGKIDTKSKREGFAEDYDGLFNLRKVRRVLNVVPKECGFTT
jgi:hypothetical protein